jgi:hypothetical protein
LTVGVAHGSSNFIGTPSISDGELTDLNIPPLAMDWATAADSPAAWSSLFEARKMAWGVRNVCTRMPAFRVPKPGTIRRPSQ